MVAKSLFKKKKFSLLFLGLAFAYVFFLLASCASLISPDGNSETCESPVHHSISNDECRELMLVTNKCESFTYYGSVNKPSCVGTQCFLKNPEKGCQGN